MSDRPTRPSGQSWIHAVRDSETDSPVAEFALLPEDEREPLEGGGQVTTVALIGPPVPAPLPMGPDEAPTPPVLIATRNTELVIARDLASLELPDPRRIARS